MSVAATRPSPSLAAWPGAWAVMRAVWRAAPVGLSGLALGVWTASLQQIDLSRVTGLGLISALPWQTIASFVLFTVAFMLGVYQSRIVVPLVLAQLVVWVFMLHGMGALISPEPVFSVAWRHAGIADYILRTRSLDPTIDAYFSWPGFFGWSALVARVAGLANALGFIRWAPVFFNLLFLAPLVMIFQSATAHKRILWLGLWVFYTGNWIGQDYFSPQAMAYFAYLLVFALLLKWFPGSRRTRGQLAVSESPSGARPEQGMSNVDGGPLAPGGASPRLLAAGALIAVFAATVPSHQLTPFAIVAGTAALAVFRQCTSRSLPLLFAVVLGTWIIYMTTTFLSGHLDMAFGPAGLEESAAANVGGRLQGTREHLVVVYTRMATAGLVWMLAAFGALRARKSFRRVLPYAILAATPFPLMVLQAYGGEMLLRIYLLTLPFCALFIGGLLTVNSESAGLRALAGGAAAVLGVVLMFGFLVSRYGNHLIDLVTPGEVEAVAELYRLAPPGSLLLAGDGNLPWKYRDYEGYKYKTLTDYKLEFGSGQKTAKSLARVISREDRDAFLIITRGQKETVKLLGEPVPAVRSSVGAKERPDWLAEIERSLRSSEEFELVFENKDATIFVLSGEA